MGIKKGPIAERIATGPSWGYLFHSGQNESEFNQINPDLDFFNFSNPFLSTSSTHIYEPFHCQDA